MKLLFSFFMLFLIKKSTAQENIFIGKIEYIQETKLLSGEFAPKGNSEFETFFNNESYAFVQQMKVDIDGTVDRLMVKSMPNEIVGDSFEIAKQRESIKRQLGASLNRPAVAKTFINFMTNIAQKPKVIGNKSYCLIDSLSKIIWELKEETLTIEGLFCQKARGFFIDKYYDVWFAPSVPFAAGPLYMHGLPGVIVLATSEDEKTRYRMKSLTYPLASPVKMSSCNGEKQISKTQFMMLQSKKREAFLQNMEEMKKKNDKQ
jgi:GLPGLI family protein